MKRIQLTICLCVVSAFLGAQESWAKPEPWYFNMGLGWGSPSYPTAIQSSLDTLKTLGVTSTPIAIDVGAYWPIGKTTVLGGCINGLSDSYTKDTTSMSIVQTGLYVSSMHFFGEEPGVGLFLRGDVGAGRAAVTLNNSVSAASSYGPGAGAGVGYGFPVSDETRLLLQGNYMYRRIESNDYGALAITLNGFF